MAENNPIFSPLGIVGIFDPSLPRITFLPFFYFPCIFICRFFPLQAIRSSVTYRPDLVSPKLMTYREVVIANMKRALGIV